MAISLPNNGSSPFHYYTAASAVVTAAPLTMACWFRTTSLTAEQLLLSIGRSGTSNHYFFLELGANAVNDPIYFGANAGSGVAFAGINTTVATNTWYHAAGVSSSAASRFAFWNGTKGTENTTSRTPSSLNTTGIGVLTNNTPSTAATLRGEIAEAGIWSAALDDAEVAALAKGVSPLKVRPQSLVLYAPLVRESINVKGGVTLSATGSPTVAAHPRIYY